MKLRFSDLEIMYMTPLNEEYIYNPSAGPKSLMIINVGKQLESHDEQLIFIILIVSRYNRHGFCDF
jgi:hypothetical protein